MKCCLLILVLATAALAVPLEKKPVPIERHPTNPNNVKIVGGLIAKENQFPWQVAVYYDTSEGSYFCGGALIRDDWVLTAGHCVYHATVFTLHLGANSLVDDDVNRVTLGVSHSVVHPDYDPTTLENDIGLVKIDVNYTTNDHIKIIPFATTELKGDVEVTVSGWGATGDWDGVSNDLNYVELKSITNDDCKNVYGETAIKDGMVCAVGPNNEGTCNGDSGSPLIVDDGSGNVEHVGVVSWVSSAGCQTDHPSGYTRTAYYADWIQSVIEE